MMNDTHSCSRCKADKPYDEFYSKGITRRQGWRGVDGVTRTSWCKACFRAKTADWRANNATPEWKRKGLLQKKDSNRRLKDAVFGAYGGYRCACCGETERAFLSIDHVKNDGAKMRREVLGSRLASGSRTYRWLKQHNFPAGYQVLCMNCQWGKRLTGVCPHQARCNDYPLEGVGASAPKRIAPLTLVRGEEIVSSAAKVAAGQ